MYREHFYVWRILRTWQLFTKSFKYLLHNYALPLYFNEDELRKSYISTTASPFWITL